MNSKLFSSLLFALFGVLVAQPAAAQAADSPVQPTCEVTVHLETNVTPQPCPAPAPPPPVVVAPVVAPAPYAPVAPAYAPPQVWAPAYPQPVPQRVQQDPRSLRRPYTPGMSIPPGGYLVEEYRTKLLWVGASMFAGPYLIGAASISAGVDRRLAIPLIGTFLIAGSYDESVRPMLVLDGIAQTVGLALLIVGLSVKRRYIQLYASEDGKRHLALAPFAGRETGLGLDLTF